MNRKIKIIFNPTADLGRAWTVATTLRPLVKEYGEVDWSGTVFSQHATDLARQAGEEGYDLVIAVGGDGTVHEVINGLMQVPESKRPALGIIPVGSGNDLAFSAGLLKKPEEALKIAMTGTPKAFDVVLLKDDQGHSEYFDNTLGIGFDTLVTLRSRKIPFFHGFAIYLLAVIQTILFNFVAPRMQIETDMEKWEEEILMLVVCNGPREGGGFMIAPEAKADDGILHYASVRKVSRPMMFRLLPEVMKGTHARFTKQIRMGTCHKMTLKSEKPIFIHIDGEVYTGLDSKVKEISIELLPGVLKIIQ